MSNGETARRAMLANYDPPILWGRRKSVTRPLSEVWSRTLGKTRPDRTGELIKLLISERIDSDPYRYLTYFKDALSQLSQKDHNRVRTVFNDAMSVRQGAIYRWLIKHHRARSPEWYDYATQLYTRALRAKQQFLQSPLSVAPGLDPHGLVTNVCRTFVAGCPRDDLWHPLLKAKKKSRRTRTRNGFVAVPIVDCRFKQHDILAGEVCYSMSTTKSGSIEPTLGLFDSLQTAQRVLSKKVNANNPTKHKSFNPVFPGADLFYIHRLDHILDMYDPDAGIIDLRKEPDALSHLKHRASRAEERQREQDIASAPVVSQLEQPLPPQTQARLQRNHSIKEQLTNLVNGMGKFDNLFVIVFAERRPLTINNQATNGRPALPIDSRPYEYGELLSNQGNVIARQRHHRAVNLCLDIQDRYKDMTKSRKLSVMVMSAREALKHMRSDNTVDVDVAEQE